MLPQCRDSVISLSVLITFTVTKQAVVKEKICTSPVFGLRDSCARAHAPCTFRLIEALRNTV